MIISRRPSKYRNIPEVVDGMKFPSKKEAARYRELKMRERAKDITGLQCQVTYPLVVNGVPICKYIADFVYTDHQGKRIVEDVKGMLTPVYRIKAKMMWAQYGIVISEVGRKARRKRRTKKSTGLTLPLIIIAAHGAEGTAG